MLTLLNAKFVTFTENSKCRDAVICDHVVRLSMFGMIRARLTYRL